MGGKWKKLSPTFEKVVDRMRTYFGMDIKATRFNWYRCVADWRCVLTTQSIDFMIALN